VTRETAEGQAEVVLYTPFHEGDLGKLAPDEAADVVRVWAKRTAALYAKPETAYVYVFENRGREVGATLAHPHGQIYALPFVPLRLAELARLEHSRGHAGSGGEPCVVCRYVSDEWRAGIRVIDWESTDERARGGGNPRFSQELGESRGRDGTGFLALCPFAPRFPYEVQVLPERCVDRLDHLSEAEMEALGALLGRTVRRLDACFGEPMPYMMYVLQGGRDGSGNGNGAGEAEAERIPLTGESGARRDGGPKPAAYETPRHLRIVFAPLRRSRDRLKVIASSEVGADVYLTDVLPERAAAELRASLDAGR
jgi:UDPglucose--hexose-1-phosphate uridylyltransferase